MTVEISTEVYEELRKYPLFFVKYYKDIRTDENGREYDYSLWKSVNSDYSISFPAQSFWNRKNGYCLVWLRVRLTLKNEIYTEKRIWTRSR